MPVYTSPSGFSLLPLLNTHHAQQQAYVLRPQSIHTLLIIEGFAQDFHKVDKLACGNGSCALLVEETAQQDRMRFSRNLGWDTSFPLHQCQIYNPQLLHQYPLLCTYRNASNSATLSLSSVEAKVLITPRKASNEI